MQIIDSGQAIAKRVQHLLTLQPHVPKLHADAFFDTATLTEALKEKLHDAGFHVFVEHAQHVFSTHKVYDGVSFSS